MNNTQVHSSIQSIQYALKYTICNVDKESDFLLKSTYKDNTLVNAVEIVPSFSFRSFENPQNVAELSLGTIIYNTCLDVVGGQL